MGKKIIVLNGSPRRGGNTAALVDRFLQGAKEAGHQVTRFDLRDMEIHPCLGCYGGGKDLNSPCVQKDAMDEIYPVYREADVVIFASPMYFWTISGQLKCALDRLFATAEGYPDYRVPCKECALLMAAEGEEDDNFEPIIHYYQSLVKHLRWRDLGCVFAKGVAGGRRYSRKSRAGPGQSPGCGAEIARQIVKAGKPQAGFIIFEQRRKQ